MLLRYLEIKDASLMLEWMQDDNVTQDLYNNFASKKLGDAIAFILTSADTSKDLHMAIVSDIDEYMGTVSLKHIDRESGNAEFAIIVRKSAMGRGYSWYGMTEIIRIAFEELNLNCVYWCVSEKNIRAVRFYNKHGFNQVVDIAQNILDRYRGKDDMIWYSVLRGDDYTNEVLARGNVAGCKIVSINTVPTIDAGELSFFEANHDVNFDIKRIYYISKVPEGVRRGFHAHKTLKQILFCPYGKIQLILDDGAKREEITLSDSSIGVVIDHPIWREMLWMQKDSVLCVAASDYYAAEDYIRYYDEFIEYATKNNNLNVDL
jgi:RimJ/RimL family protein N-acetyltransferase